MQDEVVRPICDALTVALGVRVGRLHTFSDEIQREALLALPGRAGQAVPFTVADQRYLGCRYHRRRLAAVVVGPYLEPGDPLADLPVLDTERLASVIQVVETGAIGIGRATDVDQQRVELASQLEVASRSILAITSELALDTVLNRIVDLSRELSGARYAALGVPNSNGELEAFLTSGMSDEEEALIGNRPRGLGLLGLLLREPRTLRLQNLHEHPASVGFPANHPPMSSFLGVPIMSRGQVLGNLYLTEKRTGDEFTDDDARLVEVLARHAAVAIENAHLYRDVQVQQLRLQLIIDQLPEATLIVERDPERVTLANHYASALLGWPIETPLSLDRFLAQNARIGPDGTVLQEDQVPVVRSLRCGDVIRGFEQQIVRPDGQRITTLVNCAPLVDRDERITGSIAVFQDITQLKDAEQLKDDFLSLVSHELRTPLTTILGGALLLQRDWDALERDVQHELLVDIASESRRLGALIENMVQLANIRAGRMRMETEPVHVRRMIERAVAAIAQIAPERQMTVDIEPALLAEADTDRLDQVVRNLLHNAIKYAPPDTPIEITARRQGEMVQIGVRDYGPGIDASDVPRLFDRFSRTDRAISSNAPGMGLGLYLSRHVVEALDGSIWVEHPDDGGTRMVFTIPAILDDASDALLIV